MASDIKDPDAIHFRSIQLENVRAFGSLQCLELFDEHGEISLWNLILGENGVGKTTLLQALAVLRPFPASIEQAGDAGVPTLSTARFSEYVNEDIMRFIRRGGPGQATMTAELEDSASTVFRVGVDMEGTVNELKKVHFPEAQYALRSEGPLVIGYGAGRHVGHANLSEVEQRDPTQSLFVDAIDLIDAEEIMEKLAFAAVLDREGNDAKRFAKLKEVVAALLPHVDAEGIEVLGPRIPGRDLEQSGVHVRTPSGMTPMRDLSLGYQAMFAWTVDLAWRLFQAFPASEDPLLESAVVLIDEIDLHLHPRWQRQLRRHMRLHFPNVQFIATTHSPITAQETLSEGGTVVVVRWEGDEAHILNRPIPMQEWGYDQLLTSELFGFGSERSQQAEKKLRERIELIRTPKRSPDQEARLRELDEYVESIPTAKSPSVQSFEELMMTLAKNLPSGLAQ